MRLIMHTNKIKRDSKGRYYLPADLFEVIRRDQDTEGFNEMEPITGEDY